MSNTEDQVEAVEAPEGDDLEEPAAPENTEQVAQQAPTTGGWDGTPPGLKEQQEQDDRDGANETEPDVDLSDRPEDEPDQA